MGSMVANTAILWRVKVSVFGATATKRSKDKELAGGGSPAPGIILTIVSALKE
jgi:hypothetical protein